MTDIHCPLLPKNRTTTMSQHPPDNSTTSVDTQPWTRAFAAAAPGAFATALSEDVVLEASALYRPRSGRQVMSAAASHYTSVFLTHQPGTPGAPAFSGKPH